MIDQYLAPVARFAFYLDAPDGDVTCKAVVRYGDKEFSCLDQLRTSRVLLDSFRQGAREKQILTVLESLFLNVTRMGMLYSAAAMRRRYLRW